jgi:urea transport system ATP-binding protein
MSLDLKLVSAAYGASQVLWRVSLAFDDNQAVALLGRNGAGKTTLLRAIMGLHPLMAGSIELNGEDITALPSHERSRKGLAYVPQGRGIFPHLTVKENLEMGFIPAANGIDTAERMNFVCDLFPAVKRLFPRKGGNLSGGEQQQLAIARALVSSPKVLLLDEPTEGIQPSVIREIEIALERIASEMGVAVLLVEQYLEFAWSFAGRYYVMEKGNVIDSGAPSEDALLTVTELLKV